MSSSSSSRVLECSVKNAFESLSFLSIPGMKLIESHIEYYHDTLSLGEENAMAAGLEDTNNQCGSSDCLLDMHEFVWQLIDLGFKRLSWFFRHLLRDGRVRAYTTRLGRNFGWAPVITTFTKLMIQNDNDTFHSSSSYRIEAGGGSGLGFQLFCDGRMVMTAGGGGGGGIEGSPRRENSTNDASFRDITSDNDTNIHTDTPTSAEDESRGFNFGGGGGGGLQFDNGIVRFRAIDETNSTTLNADRTSDRRPDPYATPDTDPDQNIRTEHIQPSHRSWQWESEWVSMGGGGGCGTCTSESTLIVGYSNAPSPASSSSSSSSSTFHGYTIVCGERTDDNSPPDDDINNDTTNPFSNTTTTNSSMSNSNATVNDKASDVAQVQMKAFLHSLSQVRTVHI